MLSRCCESMFLDLRVSMLAQQRESMAPGASLALQRYKGFLLAMRNMRSRQHLHFLRVVALLASKVRSGGWPRRSEFKLYGRPQAG